MSEKILCVDDDPNILAGYKRRLRKDFKLDTALSGDEGLAEIKKSGPYAVVVSDMQMPGMNGVEFLERVHEIHPETVRIMLTGQGDLRVAMDAVNKGGIFRFLTKPCPPEDLALALNAGMQQYQLITSEKELLEKTLRGAVKVLSDVLSLVNPTAFGRASRVRRMMRQLMQRMGQAISWQIELGAMLSQIGCVTVPEETLQKVYQGKSLLMEESRMFMSHPMVGRELIKRIPRLEEISDIIAYQEKHFDGTGQPMDSVNGKDIPFGSRLLKVALDFDTLKTSGLSSLEALTEMESRIGWYDPAILDALKLVHDVEITFAIERVNVDALDTNMILAEDVRGTSGTLLIANGQEVTKSLRLRLLNFALTAGVKEPIKVFVPRATPKSTS